MESMESFVMTLLTIVGVWTLAVVSPGPDFLLITRRAITFGPRPACRTTAGILVGYLLWGLAGFFGIHALFIDVPWFYLVLKIGGGAYLIFLGARLLYKSFQPHAESTELEPDTEIDGGFQLGLMTNLCNPKAAIFTTSLFAVTLPPNPSLTLGLIAIALMVSIGAIWFFLLIYMLTTGSAPTLFHRAHRSIDRAAGFVFIAFGVGLATTAAITKFPWHL